MILSLLAFVSSFNTPALHAAPTRIIAPVQKTLPWTGHFSAKNFKQTRNDRLRLSFVKSEIKNTILALPKWHTDALDKLEIRNESNISRGLSSSEKIILHTNSIDTSDELQSVFIHEMGHIVDLGALEGRNKKRTAFFDGKTPIYSDDPSIQFYKLSWTSAKRKKTSIKRTDFVTGYAQTDCFEDFAETYLMYRLHGENFRALAKNSLILRQKYNFFRSRVFKGQEFGQQKADVAIAPIFDSTLLAIDDLHPLLRR